MPPVAVGLLSLFFRAKSHISCSTETLGESVGLERDIMQVFRAWATEMLLNVFAAEIEYYFTCLIWAVF